MKTNTICSGKLAGNVSTISLFAIILIFSLSFAGCDGLTGGGGGAVTKFTGSTGLVANYHSGSPPADVYMGNSFLVVVDAQNTGASDITEGRVMLANIVEDDVQLVGDRSKSIKLYGRSQYIPVGEKTSVVWELKAKKLDAAVISPIAAAIEYRYKTHMTESVCIDPDVFGAKTGRKICTMKQTIGLGDQGAPIAVQDVKLEMVNTEQNSGDVYFTFTIINLGPGEVSTGTIGNGEINTVMGKVSLSGKSLACDSSKVYLEEGVGELRCKGHYSSASEYKALLDVELDYLYRENLPTKEINIKKTRI